MARQRLNLDEEERRKYNNEMHRKQDKARREKAKREAFKTIVASVLGTFEELGWEKTELVVGAEETMIEAVADSLIESGKFKIVLGQKVGIKVQK